MNVLAREYCDECRPKRKLKPIILSHHMMPGLLAVSGLHRPCACSESVQQWSLVLTKWARPGGKTSRAVMPQHRAPSQTSRIAERRYKVAA